MSVPCLFVAAHPDDELLAMSVPLVEHLAGGYDVHVLWLSRGTGSGVLDVLNGDAPNPSPWWGLPHSPLAEGYQPLTADTMGEARLLEAHAAVRVLAAGLPGSLSVHCADLPDGKVSQAAAVAAIRAVADQVAPGGPVRLKTHSWLVENHSDHLAAGKAARQLKVDEPARFGDVRYYVESPCWSDSRLSQVSEGFDGPATAELAARVRNAVRQYAVWAPDAGRFAIGYHSVASMLDPLAATPKSMVHP